MSSGKWRPFCLGLNVLKVRIATNMEVVIACPYSSHWGVVTHICVNEFCQHWFKWCHYPNHCCVVVNEVLRKMFQWRLSRHTKFAFRKMHWKMSPNIVGRFKSAYTVLKVMRQHGLFFQTLYIYLYYMFTTSYWPKKSPTFQENRIVDKWQGLVYLHFKFG